MASNWPPPEGLCSPTVSRNDAVLSLSASATISAPAAFVFDAVLHVAEYEKWNTFIPKAHITSQPSSDGGPHDLSHMRIGSIMDFYAVMDAKKPQNTQQTGLQVSDISTPDRKSQYIDQATLELDPAYTADLDKVYRVSWKSHGGFVSRGLRTERIHEIIILSDNECEVRTWEVMGGALASVVKWMYGKTLQQKFQLWVDDLKKHCERQSTVVAVT